MPRKQHSMFDEFNQREGRKSSLMSPFPLLSIQGQYVLLVFHLNISSLHVQLLFKILHLDNYKSLHTLCLHSWPRTTYKLLALNFSLQWLFHMKFGKHTNIKIRKLPIYPPPRDSLNISSNISHMHAWRGYVSVCINYIHILIGFMLNIK